VVAAGAGAADDGLLLAFEGIDGSGKSTQVQRCAAWLAAAAAGGAGAGARAAAVRVVREPGGTPLGEAVRELLLAGGSMSPLSEMLLYMAARAELYSRVVLPALRGGEIVLLDRSHYSTEAYQGAGLGLDREAILSLARTATGGRLPDRVVLFDIAPEAARRRLAQREADRRDGRGAASAESGRAGDRIEQRDATYFERVAASYRAMAAAEPARFTVIDASAEAAAVEAAVRQALQPLLAARGGASRRGG
jgi:dTMP kinase